MKCFSRVPDNTILSTRLPQSLSYEQGSTKSTLKKIAADQIFKSLCTQKFLNFPLLILINNDKLISLTKEMDCNSLKIEQWKKNLYNEYREMWLTKWSHSNMFKFYHSSKSGKF